MINFLKILGFQIIPFFLLVNKVWAQPDVGPAEPSTTVRPGPAIGNPLKNIDSIPGLINAVLGVVVQIGLPVIALAIVYTGFLFVAARGSEGKLEKAKETLFWTVIGAAIVLGAFVLSTAIQGTINAITG